jgi:hypothetical protein
MISRGLTVFSVLSVLALIPGCGIEPMLPDREIETGFAFTNFSRTTYAALGIRDAEDDTTSSEYFMTPLLPPGGTFRMKFLEAFDVECPRALDFRIYHYRRVNDELPIGLDPGEGVEADPIVAGEILDVPACGVQVVESFTVVNWDTPEGFGRVKFAQGTNIESALAVDPRFDNADVVWETEGVEAGLLPAEPMALPEADTISGRVLGFDGKGVADVGVLIRTRFRIRLNDDDEENDPDAGFGAPIAFTLTDVDGTFSFDRPAGGYRVEFFSDEWLFRPAVIDVESPQSNVITIVEPVE